jgi:hypothetical protein
MWAESKVFQTGETKPMGQSYGKGCYFQNKTSDHYKVSGNIGISICESNFVEHPFVNPTL